MIRIHLLLLAAVLETQCTAAFQVPFQTSTKRCRQWGTVKSNKVMHSLLMSEDSVTDVPEMVAVDEQPAAVEAPEAETSTESPIEDTGFKMYASNFPKDYTREQIAEVFAPYGPVSQLSAPIDRFSGGIRGFCFFTLPDKDLAQKAIDELAGQELVEGLPLVLNEQRPRGERGERRPSPRFREPPAGTKLYVGNLPFSPDGEADKAAITALFEPFGNIEECFLPMDPQQGTTRGFAFVTMTEEPDAVKAMEDLDGQMYNGRPLKVNKSLPRGSSPAKTRNSKSEEDMENKIKLYVGNLDFDTDAETISAVFCDYGDIYDVYLPMDRDYEGRSRGFAFVTMERNAGLQAMEETDGFELDGRFLRVNEAQPRGFKPEPVYDDGY